MFQLRAYADRKLRALEKELDGYIDNSHLDKVATRLVVEISRLGQVLPKANRENERQDQDGALQKFASC